MKILKNISLTRSLQGAALGGFLLATSSAWSQTILNPGFEEGLSDWVPRMDRNMSSASAEAAHTGSFGLRVVDQDEKQGSGLLSLTTDAEAGKKYELSFWYRTTAGEGGVQVALFFVNQDGKPIQKKPPTVMTDKSPEWKRFSISAVAPEETTGMFIQIHSINAGTVTADLDDFELKEAAN
ncbi:MAG: hypothetical protein E6Q40_11540 [Cupriavidus sp.]|nr:MAG: hypothetical protein E6Q40_11540 [Cupriavidus sp.]